MLTEADLANCFIRDPTKAGQWGYKWRAVPIEMICTKTSTTPDQVWTLVESLTGAYEPNHNHTYVVDILGIG